MAVPATECCVNCCNETWILALSVADILSDFLYFEELYTENNVPDGVAFAVLGFAIVGLMSFLSGPFSDIGTAVSISFEDFPIIIITTAIQAYLAGADVREWHAVAIVSYVFSMFAMQQKVMKLGLVKSIRDILNPRAEEERQAEIGPCYWWVVFVRSLAAVAFTVLLAWALSAFIIFFAPDPPGER
ncbi:expressed unknown protein [Ectocarpus siliculosus]|uniref:Transmembrane protein n=1 Tax=Ectocarpus siliculosus TaxID=2880 RepID=D7FJF0_ECTSI|nr:expressed unknown protein [Ectocarpus siliculosus]|eukprot:CBJ29053.1 expressed unknown protein [Ectocarpus siliculosus]